MLQRLGVLGVRRDQFGSPMSKLVVALSEFVAAVLACCAILLHPDTALFAVWPLLLVAWRRDLLCAFDRVQLQ